MDALKLAELFHMIYERRAPEFGYETRKETKDFDPTTPNGQLMVAVCGEIIKHMEAGDFWSNLVYPEGAKPQEIEAELTDYHEILGEVDKVYDYVTCGRISKPNASARVVIDEFEELWERKDDKEDTYVGGGGVIFCSHCGSPCGIADEDEK